MHSQSGISVCLHANVGFLALPSLGNANEPISVGSRAGETVGSLSFSAQIEQVDSDHGQPILQILR